MLATASLGAIWSSCSPDFGPTAIADRFTQIEPVLLFTVDGYHYGGKQFDITRDRRGAARPSCRRCATTVLVPYLDDDRDAAGRDTVGRAARRSAATLAFEPMAFDDPLWVLYSSGTTGLPKPILHGHGGMLLEHAKQLALHLDLGPGDRFFWFSTTGWMMWNLLVSGLAVGASIVLYDGNPAYPDQMTLWRLAERHRDHLPRAGCAVHPGLREGRAAARRRCRPLGDPDGRIDRRAVAARRDSPGSTRRSAPTSCCRRCPAGPTSAPRSSAALPTCRCAPA